MPGFLKVSAALLHSTTWRDPVLWRLMETAGLLAVPDVLDDPTPQLDVRSAQPTGYVVPPGRYGLAKVSGLGIVDAARLGEEEGTAGLIRLGEPEFESRDQTHEGRRVVRVDGGFVVLNYAKFRDKDFTAAARMATWRARQEGEAKAAAAPKKPRTTWLTPFLAAWTRGVLHEKQVLRPLSTLRKAISDDAAALRLITWFAEHQDDRGRFGVDYLVKHWSAQLHEMQNGSSRGGASVLDIGREAMRQQVEHEQRR